MLSFVLLDDIIYIGMINYLFQVNFSETIFRTLERQTWLNCSLAMSSKTPAATGVFCLLKYSIYDKIKKGLINTNRHKSDEIGEVRKSLCVPPVKWGTHHK